jgi:hypothetical protein
MDKGWVIVCGVLIIVLLVNVGLIISALRYRKSNIRPLISINGSDILNPWQDEDQALEDLHEEVQALKDKHDGGSLG